MNLFAKFEKDNKIVTSIKKYVLALLLTTGRKTVTSMSRTTTISPKTLYNFMNEADSTIPIMYDILCGEAKKLLSDGDYVNFIFDFSQLIKNYAQKIGGLGYDRNGCSNRTEKGISFGIAALSSAKKCIPFDLKFWIQKKYAEGGYIKKTDLAMLAIEAAIKKDLKFRYALLDGAFACKAIIDLFEKLKQKYFMRIPSNRVIEVDGLKAKIKDQPQLKLLRNLRAKVVAAKYQGIPCFITADKRKKKNGEYEVVYIISNVNLATPQDNINEYAKRSPVEGFFRTGKQTLGIDECQMLSRKKQEAHILGAMISYIILEENKTDNQKNCPEDIVHEIRKSDLRYQFDDLSKKRSHIPGAMQKSNRASANSAMQSMY